MDHLYQILLTSDQLCLTRYFKSFSFRHGIEFFEQLSRKADHPRIIPVKFHDNPPSCLEGDVV